MAIPQMVIKLLQKHIDIGVPGDPDSCPIFHAMYDAGFRGHSVGSAFVTLHDGIEVEIPSKATKFIGEFDCGDLVGPIDFVLNATP